MNGEKARRFFVRFDPQAVTKVLIAGFTVASLLGLAGSAEAAPAPDPPGKGHGAPAEPPGQGTPPQGPQDTPAATRARTQADPPTGTFTVDAFQTDLFTGAATAQIPIVVTPGAAGTAPQIILRYNSGTADEIGPRDQGPWTGLGWTLDSGGFVLRDTKNTTSPGDDTFKLVFGGASHDLVLIDAGQNLYHTKDETFLKLQYNQQADYWTLWTKDGTGHRFGFNSDSKGIALGQDLVTPVTYKYMLDEVTTTIGTSVRYAYAKQTATAASTGRSYDQAVYPDTITWSYQGGALVGVAREVRFFRASRTDYTDTSASTSVSFFERERLDSIEVRVGGSLVRQYVFAFDYSIDRDASYTWGGGATGDLTLRSMTVYGSDGASALPSVAFTYADARLSSASNGIGGSVSYSYERVTTNPLYSACKAPVYSCDELGYNCSLIGCGEWGASTAPDQWGFSTLLGNVCAGNLLGTTPVYSACKQASYSCDELGYNCSLIGCAEWGASTAPDQWGFSTLLGYGEAENLLGTTPVYSACKQAAYSCDELGYNCSLTGCAEWGASTAPDQWGFSTLLAYIYVSKVDRYRVITRSLSDGRGGTAAMTYSYQNLALSSDGKEFRGHGAARAIDALGNYTDTWFYQDDLKKGRPYASETRSQSGALYAQTSSTWSTSNPYPGVTFVRLDRTDAYSYEGGSTPKQTAATFEYDAYGNRIRAVSLGDGAVSGDERDERTDWAVDAASWLMRPTRVALHDGAGTLLRERWLSYDGLGWGSLGARGLLTRDEARLAGGRGASGNPVVTHAYDGYGNRTATTDPRGCTTTTTFEAEQVYPASATTCLGHTTTFAHDARFGVRTSLTDPNGQTTTSTYDVFGRLTRVTGPFDTGSTYGSVSTVYENLGSPSAQRIVTYRTEQHGTGSVLWSAQYFDGVGRVYKTEAEGPGGQVIVSETTFDSRGLVAQRSAPRFTAEAALWTTLSYDALGRPVQVRHPDSSVATTSYALSGVAGAVSQVAVTDERGTVRRRHLSAHGQLLRVEEVNGAQTSVTTYQYDGTGALTQVTDHAGRVTTMTYDALGRKGAVQDPNMGYWTYGYDVTGNLTSQTDARGQTLTFTHDLQGRILTKAYPGGAQIQWTYDDPAVAYSRGRLTRVDDLAVSTRFTYNALGRVTQTVRLLDATSYVMSQSYDALGRVVTQTFPDSETVTYTYNEAGWLSAVPGYVTSLTYNARGQRTQMQYANGVTATWTYDATTFRLSNAQAANGATALQNLSYAYDAGGLITGITDSLWTGTRSFGYDALGRLLSASGPFGALSGGIPGQTTETYTYDATGNILTKAGLSYTYADPLHPAAVTTLSDGTAYTYDAAGNMLNGAGRALSWDADGRLAAVSIQGGNTATFAYDYTGMRVRKQTASGALRYPFGGYEEDSTGVRTKYLFLGLERVALKRSTGQTSLTFWYHNDHLGGVNVLTDATGAKVQLVEYDPWGKVTRTEGTVDLTHRFTGKELDPETGLYYYGGRYYDPLLGRFISADPFVPSPGNPQSLNRYSYTLNDPVNHLDPSGYFFRSIARFFSRLFRSVVRQLPAILVGIAVAAVGVATGGFGLGLAGPALGIVVGAAGGAAAGLTNFALGLGPPEGILYGALFGAVAGAVGPSLAGAYGGGFGGAVGAGATLGGAFGGISAAIAGGNVLEGLAGGAIAGAVVSAAVYGGYKLAEWLPSAVEAGGDAATPGKIGPTRYLAREIDRVRLTFEKGADQPISAALADRFEAAVSAAGQEVPELQTLQVSSTVRPGTLHQYGQAIDVSRVNGIPMYGGYGSSPVVTATVRSLQTNIAGVYENFGPYRMTGGRPGAAADPGLIRDHRTHVHFSVRE